MVFIKRVFFACVLCGLLAAFFLTPQKAAASRNITISADKTVLNGYDEMTVTVSSMSGFTDGETIYIKGAFYKDGSTNYFGYTKNNDTWIKNGDTTVNQKQVQIGNWDQKLVIQSDFSDSGYVGEGDYKLKVGFYYTTSGGSVSSVNWSTNSLDITINDPDPTPTSLPTSTPVPTSTPKPTPTPTAKPTATKSPTFAIASLSAESSDSGILGASTTAEPTLVEGISETQGRTVNWVALFLVVGGIFVLSSCGILFYYQRKKGTLAFWKTYEDPNK